MEDAHIAILDLLAGTPDAKDHAQKLSFFGVFDGHGGDKVALYTGDNIHNIISSQETFKAGKYEQALKDGFLATDRAILSGTAFTTALVSPSTEGHVADKIFFDRPQVRRGGVWLHRMRRSSHRRKDLHCQYLWSLLHEVLQLTKYNHQANAGDSRSVLGVKGRAKPLSFDHKPQNEGTWSLD